MTIDEILKELKRLRKNKPNVTYEEYWNALRPVIEEENRLFVEMDEKMKIDWDKLNRPFTI